MSRETRAMTSMQDLLQVLVQQQQQEAERWKRLDEERQLEARQREQDARQREQDAYQREEDNRRRDEHLVLLIDKITETHAKPKLSPPNLKPFQESDDIEVFIELFEQHMITYKVEEEQWTAHFRALLTGEAAAAYRTVPREKTTDYSIVRTAILARFGLDTRVYRQRWWTAERRQNDTGTRFANRLWDLAGRYADGCVTLDDIKHAFTIERFLRSLPSHVEFWVRDKQPCTIQDAGRLADQYVREKHLDWGSLYKTKRWKLDSLRNSPSADNRVSAPSVPDMALPDTTSKSGKPQNFTKSQVKTRPMSKYFDSEKGAMCFNCREWGHMGAQCPKRIARIATGGNSRHYVVQGTVGGSPSTNIKLDSGAEHTAVRSDYTKNAEPTDDVVLIESFSGHVTTHSVVRIKLQVGDRTFWTRAAVKAHLKDDVLLGVDLPLFDTLMQDALDARRVEQTRPQDQTSVTPTVQEIHTRTSGKRETLMEQEDLDLTDNSGVTLTDLDTFQFDESIFKGGNERPRLTRSQKREQARQLGCHDTPLQAVDADDHSFQVEQKSDLSLKNAWMAAEKDDKGEFRCKHGVLFHKGKSDGEDVTQLVVPQSRRRQVLKLSHTAPLAGHFGKRKTVGKILPRFYWPGIERDVAAFCRECVECQRAAKRPSVRAPLQLLPVIDTPFERMAMDVVGPLPSTKRGNKYLLTLMDYASKYPEANH